MQDFFTFILQNWPFVALLLVIVAVIVWFETRTTVGGISKIDPQSLVFLINRENATVIDVRDANAFKEGHIVGSINMPMSQLVEQSKKLQKFKGNPVVLVCAMGVSSMKAAKELKTQAFEKVYSLSGGISAWRNASLPLEKGDLKAKSKLPSKVKTPQ